ncbi:MAG: aromatic ring-hydroxylating oxygenase subunit alpha, partial [Sphingomonadaceae bacterium]
MTLLTAIAQPAGAPESDPQADWGLPGWVYHDPEFVAAEMARVFRPSWQLVCHLADLPEAGDWMALDLPGLPMVVVRGDDGQVRGFANICRHRGSKVVDGAQGNARRLLCPYHAWAYGLDGRLLAVPDRADYPALDVATHGLTPLEVEVWRGFVFVRAQDDGGPTVAQMMAPHEAEVGPYRLDELRPIGRVTIRPRVVNWKNIGDNYSDALHIPVAHPGLTRLLGRSYRLESTPWVDRMVGEIVERPSSNWSERHYQRVLPERTDLPPGARRRWLYLKLWPNAAFEIYPDQVDFMQWLPTGPSTAVIREIAYALPDARREMRAARWLNWRINRQVNAEDTVLIGRVQQGMESGLYQPGPLGASETALRAFARRMRALIPEARLDAPPPPGWSARHTTPTQNT